MGSSWHGGKGFDRRKSFITIEMEDLRWELWQSTTSKKRKEEIKKRIKELENTKQ